MVRAGALRVRHTTVVGSLLTFLIATTAIILITIDKSDDLTDADLDVPFASEHIALLQQQAARQHMLAQDSLGGAIAELSTADHASGARMMQLYHSPWLEDIFGKDTTYDTNYIKSLKAGDVSVAGYDGLPVAKGILPSSKDLDLADKMLSNAISAKTMPAVDNLWDGKPYVPDQDFKDKLTAAWAGFHQAVGEKRWEKKVNVECGTDSFSPGCQQAMGGTHEGYQTKWDGTDWQKFDGTAWNKLQTDDAYGYKV